MSEKEPEKKTQDNAIKKAENNTPRRVVRRPNAPRTVERGDARRNFIFLLGILIFFIAILYGYFFYFKKKPNGLPILGPPSFSMKEKPDDPGGLDVMKDDVTESDINGTGLVHLAPMPEQPSPLALTRQIKEEKDTEEITQKVSHDDKTVKGHEASSASEPLHGSYAVQLAALNNMEQAKEEWGKIKKRFPNLISPYQLRFITVSRGAHEFVRVRLYGFSDKDAAQKFCVHFKDASLACDLIKE